MFESLKKNYIGAIIGMLLAFAIAALYYLTGQLGVIVKPMDTFLEGKYVMVMLIFSMAGLVLGSFVNTGGDEK